MPGVVDGLLGACGSGVARQLAARAEPRQVPTQSVREAARTDCVVRRRGNPAPTALSNNSHQLQHLSCEPVKPQLSSSLVGVRVATASGMRSRSLPARAAMTARTAQTSGRRRSSRRAGRLARRISRQTRRTGVMCVFARRGARLDPCLRSDHGQDPQSARCDQSSITVNIDISVT
jgi:hypothetical protein